MTTKKDARTRHQRSKKHAHAPAHGMTMKYVGTTQTDRLTEGETYDVVDWLSANGQHISALVIADDGNLYVATDMQNASEWEIADKASKKDE